MAASQSIDKSTVSEEWRVVPGFRGYEVSSEGRVRSYWKSNGQGPRVLGDEPRLLKPGRHKHGYHKYTLVNAGKKRTIHAHTLVLEAFVGRRPSGAVACHGPLGVQCDSVGNLSWGTQAKNCGEDKRRDGTAQIGEKHGCARFTEAQIIEIRRLYKGGTKQVEIAKMFGCGQGYISDICLRKSWGHIGDEDIR